MRLNEYDVDKYFLFWINVHKYLCFGSKSQANGLTLGSTCCLVMHKIGMHGEIRLIRSGGIVSIYKHLTTMWQYMFYRLCMFMNVIHNTSYALCVHSSTSTCTCIFFQSNYIRAVPTFIEILYDSQKKKKSKIINLQKRLIILCYNNNKRS